MKKDKLLRRLRRQKKRKPVKFKRDKQNKIWGLMHCLKEDIVIATVGPLRSMKTKVLLKHLKNTEKTVWRASYYIPSELDYQEHGDLAFCGNCGSLCDFRMMFFAERPRMV